MYVVGFVGSPRKAGNTDTVVSEFLRGARSVGATVDKVYLNDLSIRPCQACDYCKTSSEYLGCALADEMDFLYEKLLRAESFMLGCPIYCFGPSAQAKVFLDRWYALSYRDSRGERQSTLKGKRLAIALLYGDDNPFSAGAMSAYATFRDEAKWCGMELVGTVYGSASKPGEISKNQEVLLQAYELGKACGSSNRGNP